MQFSYNHILETTQRKPSMLSCPELLTDALLYDHSEKMKLKYTLGFKNNITIYTKRPNLSSRPYMPNKSFLDMQFHQFYSYNVTKYGYTVQILLTSSANQAQKKVLAFHKLMQKCQFTERTCKAIKILVFFDKHCRHYNNIFYCTFQFRIRIK